MPNRPGRPLALGVARRAFVRELVDAAEDFERVRGGRGLPRTVTRRAEDSFFRVAAALEEFLTTWMIRSLARDGSVMRTLKQAQAEKALKLQLKHWLDKEIGFDDETSNLASFADVTVSLRPNAVPDRPTLTESRRLLKATDDTLSFENAQKYIDLAMTSLAPQFTTRVRRLEPRHRTVLDATRMIRNAIAHASARAVASMNGALHSPDLPPELRLPAGENVGRNGVGRYLSQRPGVASPRLLYYLDELTDVAHRLEPTKGRRPSLLS